MTAWQLLCALGAEPKAKRAGIDQKAIREQFRKFRDQLAAERRAAG